MSIDFNRAAMLLHIAEASNPVKWPKLRAIHEAAMAELEEIAGVPKPEPVVVPKHTFTDFHRKPEPEAPNAPSEPERRL